MKRVLGPVLYARPAKPEQWCFDVALLIDGGSAKKAPPCSLESPDAEVTGPEAVADFSDVGRGVYWRWRITCDRAADAESIVRYRFRATGAGVDDLDGAFRRVAVPAVGQLPRIFFFSCNGFSSADLMHDVDEPNALWRQAMEKHEGAIKGKDSSLRGGHHLLVGGGDQIYADSLWFSPTPVPELDALRMLPRSKRPSQPVPAGFEQRLVAAYLDLYADRWSQKEVAAAQGAVPGVYTWDDHDLFDGWGSYDDELQGCRYYQTIYRAARRTFEAFQLCGGDLRVGAKSHCLQAICFTGKRSVLDVLLLDLRSDRSLEQVMSEAQWTDLNAWLGDRALRIGGDHADEQTRRHVLVVSSIPLIYLRFAAWQEAAGRLIDLDDDLRDQWESKRHLGERARLVMTLLTHASMSKSQVTVLSGDVHVGSHGRFDSRDASQSGADGLPVRLEQLTSSAIVHPTAKAWQLFLMQIAGSESDEEINAFVTARLLSVGRERYLRQRNWLAIDFDEPRGVAAPPVRLWAQWFTEQGAVEPQVVVQANAP